MSLGDLRVFGGGRIGKDMSSSLGRNSGLQAIFVDFWVWDEG